jgi:TetR/AcrR family transcriptional repressor of nem operon
MPPSKPDLEGVRDLFVSLMHEADGESYGCMITNAAVELDASGGAYRHVREGLAILSQTFSDRLHAASREGSLRANIDPDVAAAKLLALYQGILVLVRAQQDKSVLERLVAAEFLELERDNDS